MNYLFHSSHPRNKNYAYAFFKAGFIESWRRGYLKIQDEPEADYTTRYLHWTEDNRLHTVADVRHYSYYAYDYSGERTLKMTGDASDVDQNALEQHIFSSFGYTKHYYAGTERVVARIGSGGLSHNTPCISQDDGVTRRTDSLFWHNWELIDQYEYKKAENLEGACFCCGVMCPEYLGIYKMDGTLLYEVIAAMDYEYCNGYKSLHDFCVREISITQYNNDPATNCSSMRIEKPSCQMFSRPLCRICNPTRHTIRICNHKLFDMPLRRFFNPTLVR